MQNYVDFFLKMIGFKGNFDAFWNGGGMPSWQKLGPLLQNKRAKEIKLS